MFYYMCYISTASYEFTDHQLKDLLLESRRNNERRGITGMLIHYDGNFIQYIEGNKYDVTDLFESIKSDVRHRSVYKITSGITRERKFRRWSMAFEKLGIRDAQKIPGFKPFDSETLLEEFPANENHPGIVLLRSFMGNTKKYKSVI
ncbi:BLUF domain-containing protein [Flavobacteriaceae bacterium M23B6Z8]